MKIINLHAENFKRLSAVDITPNSDMVVLSGANEQGKSSVLDAIMAAISGGRGMKDIPEPVKRGEERAEVVLDLGDIKIRRIWETAGKNRIEVTNADGAKYSSPQGILDALTSALTFDPLEFARMAPRDQRATLLRLVVLPFDLDENNQQRAQLVTAATAASQAVKHGDDVVKALRPVPDGTPDEEKPAADILKEMQALRDVQHENNTKRNELDLARSEWRELSNRYDIAAERVENIKRSLAEAEELLTRITAEKNAKQSIGERLTAEAAALVDPDTSALDEQLATLDEINKNVRQKKANAAAREELTAARAAEKRAKDALAAHDKERADALAATKFPVEGLGFSEDGVLLNGLPFAQASESQRIMTSAAMGMAMNPRLRVMFVRDASALDSTRTSALEELAKANDFQMWLEKVDETGAVGIVIEDGKVKSNA